MADCEWVILCDYAFSSANGKLCLIGIFDRINSPSVPASHAQAAIAFGVIGDAQEEIDLRFQIVRPTGGVLMRFGGPAQLAANGVTRGSINLRDLVLPDFGNYAIEVYNGQELLKTGTFSVTQSAVANGGDDAPEAT